jgi:hypothetical protein
MTRHRPPGHDERENREPAWHAYHLIIYGIQPIFAAGAIKANNGR